MDGTTLSILAFALAALLPAALVHELARAAVALLLTRERVCVALGAGGARWSMGAGRLVVGISTRPWWGGECLHTARSRRRAAAIALAGPLAADAVAVAALLAAMRWPGALTDHPVLQTGLLVFALVALTRAFADLVVIAGDRLAHAPRRRGAAVPAR